MSGISPKRAVLGIVGGLFALAIFQSTKPAPYVSNASTTPAPAAQAAPVVETKPTEPAKPVRHMAGIGDHGHIATDVIACVTTEGYDKLISAIVAHDDYGRKEAAIEGGCSILHAGEGVRVISSKGFLPPFQQLRLDANPAMTLWVEVDTGSREPGFAVEKDVSN